MKTRTATPCTIVLMMQGIRPIEYGGQVVDRPAFSLRLQLPDGSTLDAQVSRTDYEKAVLNSVPI